MTTAVASPETPGTPDPGGAGRRTAGRVGPVAVELARRSTFNTVRIPATIIPVLIMPVFFTIAFSGAFGAITVFLPTDNVLDWMGEPALPLVKKFIDSKGTRKGRYGIGILGRIAELQGW